MAYRRNNYSFVIDSSFQPFSFQELIQPLALYKDAFEKTEAAYSDLQTKANIWDGLASEENDPETYEQYRKYATDLRKQAEDLSKRGLNMVNRSKLMDLKSRYASEIVPIEEAYKTRRAQIEEQRKALLQNPTLLLSRRADMTSLDDYLRNPQLGYESYNGALLTQQVGQAASAIAKSLTDYSNGKPLDGFTRTWLQQHGYSAAEVAQAISNPGSSQSSRVLNAIVDNVVADSRIADWADTSTLNQAYGYARQGLWNAVGQTQVGTYTDEAAKIAAQEESAKRVAKYQAELAGANSPLTGFDPEFDTRNIRTDKDIEDDTKNKQMLEEYKDYFEKSITGLWKLTAEGERKIKEANATYSTPYTMPYDLSKSRKFRDWLVENGLSEMSNGRYGKNQSDKIESMINRSQGLLDMHSAIEYTRSIGSENYDDVIGSLNRISNDGEIKNYKRVREGNDYKYAPADDVEVSKLTNSNIKSAQAIYGEHGDFLEVKLDNGETILQPFQLISPTYGSVVSGNRNSIAKYREAKASGVESIDDQYGRPIPIDDLINAELNSYGMNLSSSLSRTKIKPREVEPNYYGTR